MILQLIGLIVLAGVVAAGVKWLVQNVRIKQTESNEKE